MKIRATTAFNCGEPIKKDDIVDFPEETALSLIAHELAVSAEPIAVTPTQVDEPAEETKPVGKKKK